MLDTVLSRSEHVLAMAVLYKLQIGRECRAASVSVGRADLRATAFADALARFLSGSGARNVAPVAMATRKMEALTSDHLSDRTASHSALCLGEKRRLLRAAR